MQLTRQALQADSCGHANRRFGRKRRHQENKSCLSATAPFSDIPKSGILRPLSAQMRSFVTIFSLAL
jgi:hypothetical protein